MPYEFVCHLLHIEIASAISIPIGGSTVK